MLVALKDEIEGTQLHKPVCGEFGLVCVCCVVCWLMKVTKSAPSAPYD
jgi:hypothetical protein